MSSRFSHRFLLSLIVACLFLSSAALPAQTVPPVPPTRPNIILIFSDDHAYQAVSAYGDSRHLINTPNIDSLGKDGIRFDRCLVTNSICGPSRATMLTGKYSHLNGFYNNTNESFDGSQVTFPKLLQQAGYQTAIIGKWHLVSDPTGFDFWQILPGQGIYYNPPLITNGVQTVFPGYVTNILCDHALDWLDHRDTSKPFFLELANKAPHREWEPPLDDLDFDHDRKYDPPSNLFDDYSGRGIAEHDQKMEITEYMNKKDLKLVPPVDLTPDQLTKWMAYYGPRNDAFIKANLQGKELLLWKYNRYMHDTLACIKGVDDSVGRVLKYLDDHHLAQNTIVIYSSDQGFYLGEHGWFDKRWIFEQSLRAPLLIRWPGVIQPGSVNKNIVSNLDFAETFLDAAGVSVPPDMQGHSLVPILQGKTPTDWRTSFYYHYYEYPDPHHVRPHYGVITDRYKLVHFYRDADYWELFDLQKDPDEMLSVYDRPEYAQTVADLKKELSRLEVELKVPAKDPPLVTGNAPVPDAGDDH